MAIKIPSITAVATHSSRKAWEEAAWQEIIDFLHRIRSRKELEEFLVLVLAPGERRKFVMRAAALDRIRSGKSYREIGKELWLALQTVSAIAKSLREHGYRSYRERGKTERKKRRYSSRPRKAFQRRRRTKYGTIILSE